MNKWTKQHCSHSWVRYTFENILLKQSYYNIQLPLTISQSDTNSMELFNTLLAINTVKFSLDILFIGVDIGSAIL